MTESSVAYYVDPLRKSGRQGVGDGLDDPDPDETECAHQLPDGVRPACGHCRRGVDRFEVGQVVETLARMRFSARPVRLCSPEGTPARELPYEVPPEDQVDRITSAGRSS
ncbi:hypothetical protein [Embleya sp. NPDC059259]|uniref:hypothetical protein n=1 Tax=unclassified Embleya TaxID=2699296 RepID=UPI0036C0A888